MRLQVPAFHGVVWRRPHHLLFLPLSCRWQTPKGKDVGADLLRGGTEGPDIPRDGTGVFRAHFVHAG